jgi:signal transduction histidine kinase
MADELNVMVAKLKELDDMKREFVASVTHELRSPLTAINSFVGLLLQKFYGPLTPQQQESLLTVKNNTTRLKNFIDDVLTLAHIEKQQLDMFMETFDVRETIRAVQALFAPLAMEKGLALTVDLPAVPLMATLDRIKLTHILTNLVSNALKFTKTGGVTMSARAKAATVEFDVSDTGLGISDADKSRLFTRFFRSATTAHAHTGTGLGLSIVQGLVKLHHGDVRVLDRSGGGSIFRIVFALKRPEESSGENVALQNR